MRKGVILVVVIGVMLVIFTLALAALFLMTQQSRIAEHKIKRTKAFFAAQAGMVLVLEKLRLGVWNVPPGGSRKFCINCSSGCPPARRVPDPDIPYEVWIEVSALSGGSNPIPGTAQVDISVVY